jgi:cation diffusion facilitator family transporter
LLRFLRKRHPDFSAPQARNALGRFAGRTGIICNVVLFACKLAAGLISGSVAIMADAVNNLSDAASSVVTLLGFRLARQPADRDHPFGHARYEYLSGVAVAVMILLLGAEVAKTSVTRIFHPEETVFSWLTIAILAGSVLLKLWMFRFYRTLADLIGSSALRAASSDSISDAIATAAVFSGCLAGHFFRLPLDGYLGLGAAAFILWSGIKALKETVSPLLGKRADGQLIAEIQKILLADPAILGVHDLLVHDYGPGQCYASVHAEVSASEDPLSCHHTVDALERQILETLQVHLVIHSDPVVRDDPEQERLQALVSHAASELDPRLSIHDLRLTETGLTFDLAVPYDLLPQQERLESALRQTLEEQTAYPVDIRIDAAE